MPVLSASSLSLTSSQPMIVAGLIEISDRPFWYISLFQDVTVEANESGGMILASHIRLMASIPALFAGLVMSGTPFSSHRRPPYAQRTWQRLLVVSASCPSAKAMV